MRFKIYGKPPYNTILVHGGPGAAGELEDLALRLSKNFGLIEAYQTKNEIKGLVDELDEIIGSSLKEPVDLIGFSWGAWLACIYTHNYPFKVKKVILISCPPFEEKYVKVIKEKRLERLSKDEIKILDNKLTEIDTFNRKEDADKAFKVISKIILKADSLEPVLSGDSEIYLDYSIYKKIWDEAKRIRSSGKLLDIVRDIKARIVVIHGDYDPHPYSGVRIPLESLGKDISFNLIKDCGHYPWREKKAKESFYKVILRELFY